MTEQIRNMPSIDGPATALFTPLPLAGNGDLAAADAVSILEQIEGALAYLDTVCPRANAETYRRMRLVLTAAHRTFHNRLHEIGQYHLHTPVDDHTEHRG